MVKKSNPDNCFHLPEIPNNINLSNSENTNQTTNIQSLTDYHNFKENIRSIYRYPIYFLLSINLIFLLKIIFILNKKTKTTGKLNKEENKNNTATKAILTLTPLLGVQLIVIPLPFQCNFLGQFSIFINDIFKITTSLSGFFIATLFCFLNDEVRIALARRVYKFKYDNPGKSWPKVIEYSVAYTLFIYRNPKHHLSMSDNDSGVLNLNGVIAAVSSRRNSHAHQVQTPPAIVAPIDEDPKNLGATSGTGDRKKNTPDHEFTPLNHRRTSVQDSGICSTPGRKLSTHSVYERLTKDFQLKRFTRSSSVSTAMSVTENDTFLKDYDSKAMTFRTNPSNFFSIKKPKFFWSDFCRQNLNFLRYWDEFKNHSFWDRFDPLYNLELMANRGRNHLLGNSNSFRHSSIQPYSISNRPSMLTDAYGTSNILSNPLQDAVRLHSNIVLNRTQSVNITLLEGDPEFSRGSNAGNLSKVPSNRASITSYQRRFSQQYNNPLNLNLQNSPSLTSVLNQQHPYVQMRRKSSLYNNYDVNYNNYKPPNVSNPHLNKKISVSSSVSKNLNLAKSNQQVRCQRAKSLTGGQLPLSLPPRNKVRQISDTDAIGELEEKSDETSPRRATIDLLHRQYSPKISGRNKSKPAADATNTNVTNNLKTKDKSQLRNLSQSLQDLVEKTEENSVDKILDLEENLDQKLRRSRLKRKRNSLSSFKTSLAGQKY